MSQESMEPEPGTAPEEPEKPPEPPAEPIRDAAADLRELIPELATPTPVISAPASAPAIAPEAPLPIADHLRLLHENLDLVLKRNDQQGQLLATSAGHLDRTRQELTETMALLQEVFAELDEKIERMGAATAALIRLHLQRQNPPSQ